MTKPAQAENRRKFAISSHDNIPQRSSPSKTTSSGVPLWSLETSKSTNDIITFPRSMWLCFWMRACALNAQTFTECTLPGNHLNAVLQFWHRPLWSENEHAITLCGSPLKETYLTPIIGSINSWQGSGARCVILNSFSSGSALDQGQVQNWLWLICLHILAMSNSGDTT